MKKKAIRITKSAFSLALALCMLFSCVIQSGAAQIAGDKVGWASSYSNKNYYNVRMQIVDQTSGTWSSSYSSFDFDSSGICMIYMLSDYGYEFQITSDNGKYWYDYNSGSTVLEHTPSTSSSYNATIQYASGNKSNMKVKASSGEGWYIIELSSITNDTSNWGWNDSYPGDLYWKFYKATSYEVKYLKGSYGAGTEYTDTKTKDINITLRGATFTRTGYSQTAWASNAAGTTQAYSLGASYTSNANVTLYPYWTPKTYTITYKDGGNTAFTGTHASGYPTTHTYGTATTLKSATKSGYTFGGWFTSSNCSGTAVTSLGATAYTSDITLYAKWTVANTPLAAPTNVTLSSSTVTASPGTNVTLSWNSVTNAGSYKIYKGTSTTPVATVTSTSYSIAAKYSNAGTYYVVASPSNTASYSDSEKSTGVTLTVNKTQLPAPTVSISPIDIKNGASTTATFSNYTSALSSYITGGYATLIRGTRAYGATSGAYTTNTPVTSTTGSETLSPTSDIQYGYYMAVTTAGSEYYTQSGNSSFFDVKVYANPEYRIAGESNFIGSDNWSYADGKEISN